MSEGTRVLLYIKWSDLEEIDRRAEAVGMSRSKYLVTMALLPRLAGEVELHAAVAELREGIAKYDAARGASNDEHR